jgi:YVTN family beta-propeller protein
VAVAYDPETKDTYVADGGSNFVSVVASSGKVVATVVAGPSPAGIAYDSIHHMMLITSSGDDMLTRVSASNNTVLSRVPTGGSGPTSVAFDPNNGEAYVVNSASGTVVAIGVIAGQSTTYDVGTNPQDVFFDASNGGIYVTATGPANPGLPPTGVLEVLGGSSGAIATSYTVGSDPRGIELDPLTGSIYVANCGDGTLSTLSSSGTVSTLSLNLSGCPNGVIYDSTSGRLVVSTSDNDLVYVIDPRTAVLVGALRTPAKISGYGAVSPAALSVLFPSAASSSLVTVQLSSLTEISQVAGGSLFGAYDPASKEMFVTDPGGTGHGDFITIYNALTYSQVKEFDLGQNTMPRALAYNPSDHNMYVGISTIFGKDTGYIYVIDSHDNIVNNITLGDQLVPTGIVYDPNDGNMYVSIPSPINARGGSVYVIDTSGNILSQIPVGRNPDSITYNSANGAIYVADNLGGGLVNLISDQCWCVFYNITVGGHPYQLGFDPKSNQVFVTDQYSSTISVLFGPIVINTITAPNGPGLAGVAADPSDGYIWVADGSYVLVINGQSLKTVATLADSFVPPTQVVCYSFGMAFDGRDTTIWAVNLQSSPCGGTSIYAS